MKKIILINSSPRHNANCDKAMEIIKENVKDAEVEVFTLRDKKVNQCLGCDACMRQEKAACVQKDDMADLIPRLDDCDAFVVASPVYFGMVNGPAKIFLDRLYAFFAPMKPNGTFATKLDKKAAIILTAGGGPADVYAQHGKAYSDSFHVAGAKDIKVLSFNGGNVPGEIWKNTENANQVKELAAWLCE